MSKKVSQFASSYSGKERIGKFTVEITASEAPASINLFPAPGIYEHPKGRLAITRASNQEFIDNHNAHVYQEHIPIDVEHESDTEGATGYIDLLSMNEDGSVDATVKWTKRGKNLIGNDAYKYISPEWLRNWAPPDDKSDVHHNVLVGAALTTRPFFKDLRPLVASEGKLYDLDGEERTEIVRAFDELEEKILSNALESYSSLDGGVLEEVTDDYAIITVTDNGTNTHYKVSYDYNEEADKLELNEPIGVQSRKAWETKEEYEARLHQHKKPGKGRSKMSKVEDVVKATEELDKDEQEGLFVKLAKKMGVTFKAKEEESEEEKEKREKEEKEKEEKEKAEITAKEEKEKEEKEEKEKEEKEKLTANEKKLTEDLAEANKTIKASDEKIKESDKRIVAIEGATQQARFRDIVRGRDESSVLKASEDKKKLYPFVGDSEEAMGMLKTIAEAHGEDSKEFKAYVARERGHADAIHEAGTFKETGTSGKGTIVGSAKEEFEEKVEEAMKANDKLSEGDAIALVAKENGDLYNRVDKEATKRESDYPGS